IVVQDLVRRARPFRCSALHVALEILRAMFSGEMAPAVGKRLAGLLVAAELDVLPDFPVGVRAQQERVRERRVEGGLLVPVRGDARENRFNLLEERLGVALRVRRGGLALERRERDATAGVVDENPGRAVLTTRYIPGVLVAGVGVAGTVTDP